MITYIRLFHLARQTPAFLVKIRLTNHLIRSSVGFSFTNYGRARPSFVFY